MGSNGFEIILGNERLITPSGLALVGKLLNKTNLRNRLNQIGEQKKYNHHNFECVIGYLSLLCQGKTAYEDIRELQEDPDFYCTALGMKSVASAETVRQRIDCLGPDLASMRLVMEENAKLLVNNGMRPTPGSTGHVTLDVDVSVHDNSKTKKEGVERAYNGIDGYAPIYAYLGEEGYLCNVELQEGSCHSQCYTVEFLEDTLEFAKKTTQNKLLVRMDAGYDALDNIKLFIKGGDDYIIKRNLRKESLENWLETAKKHGTMTEPREGKSIYTGSVLRDRGLSNPLRIVFQVTERTMLANGQLLLVPDIEAETWWTSLEAPESEVIGLYHAHGTCEQFHSEIKSDIGLERFPSGYFETNAAILKLAAIAYNILRIIGQTALGRGVRITRHDVFRLRAKTVIKRLIYIAGHVTRHARKKVLSLGRSNIWRDTFMEIHAAFR